MEEGNACTSEYKLMFISEFLSDVNFGLAMFTSLFYLMINYNDKMERFTISERDRSNWFEMERNGQNIDGNKMFFVILSKLLISVSCFNHFFPQTYLQAKTLIISWCSALRCLGREMLLMMEKIMNSINGPGKHVKFRFL